MFHLFQFHHLKVTTTKTIIYNEEEDGVMMVVEVAYRPSRHINSHQCTIVFISRTDFRSRGRARGRGLAPVFFSMLKKGKTIWWWCYWWRFGYRRTKKPRIAFFQTRIVQIWFPIPVKQSIMHTCSIHALPSVCQESSWRRRFCFLCVVLA